MTQALRDACVRSIHVLTTDGQTLNGADAVYFIYEEVGYSAARVLRYPPFIQVSELGYRVVAANRMLFSKFLFKNE